MDKYHKYRSGEALKLNSEFLNDMADLLKASKRGKSIALGSSTFEHDPNITDVVATSGEIFSLVGIGGRITEHSTDLNEFLNQPILEEISSAAEHFGILQQPTDGGVVECVVDGVSLCRVKLMQDPESEEAGVKMTRCTPNDEENWMYADTIGTHELLWHGTQVHDSEGTATKEDIVWGFVRLCDQIQQVVHVQLNFDDDELAKPLATYDHYDAILNHKDQFGEFVRGKVWLELEAGPNNIWFYQQQAPTFVGHFCGYDTRENNESEEEERPVISCAFNPVMGLVGKWGSSASSAGTVQIMKDETTEVDGFEVEANSPFGEVSANKLVDLEWRHGWGWIVTAESCG